MCRFVKGAMNIVDLLGILPYFMSLVISMITSSATSSDEMVRQFSINMYSQIIAPRVLGRAMNQNTRARWGPLHRFSELWGFSGMHFLKNFVNNCSFSGFSSWQGKSRASRPLCWRWDAATKSWHCWCLWLSWECWYSGSRRGECIKLLSLFQPLSLLHGYVIFEKSLFGKKET